MMNLVTLCKQSKDKTFFSYKLPNQAAISFIDTIGDKNFIILQRNSKIGIHDTKWNKLQSIEFKIDILDQEFIDSFKTEKEIFLLLKINHKQLLLARINQVHPFLFEYITIENNPLEFNNVKMVNSLSSRIFIIEGVNINQSRKLQFFILCNDQITTKPIQTLEQYNIKTLIRIQFLIVAQFDGDEDGILIINLLEKSISKTSHSLLMKGRITQGTLISNQLVVVINDTIIFINIGTSSEVSNVFTFNQSHIFLQGLNLIIQCPYNNTTTHFRIQSPNTLTPLYILKNTDLNQQQQQALFLTPDQYFIQLGQTFRIIYRIDLLSLVNITLKAQSSQSKALEQRYIPLDSQFEHPTDFMDEIELLNYIKKNRYISLDSLIKKSLKKGYLRCLLLVSSRIRNYQQFFENYIKQFDRKFKNIIQINTQTLKQCECFDQSTLKEEFVNEIIKQSKKSLFQMEGFLNFLVNNSTFLNNIEDFIMLIQMSPNFNKDFTTKYKEVFQRAKIQCGQLKYIQSIFKTDFYDLKELLLIKNMGGRFILNNSTCSICFHSFTETKEEMQMLSFTNCSHLFHFECVFRNSTKTLPSSINCPVCSRVKNIRYDFIFNISKDCQLPRKSL